MNKNDAPQTYTIIPAPRPVAAHHCFSCGYDPVHIWDGHNIVGGDWNARIDGRGQLCEACALESASHLARQYPTWTSWRAL